MLDELELQNGSMRLVFSTERVPEIDAGPRVVIPNTSESEAKQIAIDISGVTK